MDNTNSIDFEADDKILSEADHNELSDTGTKRARATKKFILAAVGAIPWIGGVIAAAAEFPDDERNRKHDDLRTRWLQEHQVKIEELRSTLAEIEKRFSSFGEDVDDRIQSPEYLSLVRQAFQSWDRAQTDEKRNYVSNLISNAAGTRVCSDDVVRLFIGWLDMYHEAHFAVIREVFENPGTTRYDIWSAIYGELPREDSAEADLYKMLVRDLSMGGVIRQERDTTGDGQFVRRRPPKRRSAVAATLKSAFDDEERYVLTELGTQFVHYTLMGDIRRLEQDHGTVQEG